MTWANKYYTVILDSKVSEYEEASATEKETIEAGILSDIHDAAADNDLSVPDNLSKKIRNWFKNHRMAHVQKTQRKKGTGGNWTLRKVVRIKLADQINAEVVSRVANATNGSHPFLSHYPQTLTDFVNGLTDAEKEEYQKIAEEWNQGDIPSDVQKKNAKKGVGKKCVKFVDEMEKQMGAKVFLLVGYQDENGDPITARFGSKHAENGQRLIPWPESMEKWNSAIFDIFTDGNGGEDGNHEMSIPEKKKSIPDVLLNEAGDPILPSTKSLDLAQIRSVVRQFITTSYRSFSKNQHAFVPWQQLGSRQEEFIDCQYLPTDFKFKDPSKMKKEELAELILFWNGRQSKKQVVLKFKSCLPGHDQSGKTRSKWNMLVDDDGEELINLNGSSDNEENIPRVGTSHPDQLSGSKQGNTEIGSPASVGKTVEAREIFLKGLDQSKEYQSFLATVFPLKDITETSSSTTCLWPAWEYQQKHVPSHVHTIRGFHGFHDWLQSIPVEANVDIICLGIGMVLRDLMIAQEIEPDADEEHALSRSEIGITQYQTCVQWASNLDQWLSEKWTQRNPKGKGKQPQLKLQICDMDKDGEMNKQESNKKVARPTKKSMVVKENASIGKSKGKSQKVLLEEELGDVADMKISRPNKSEKVVDETKGKETKEKGKKRELEVGAGDSVNTKGDTKANEQATGPRKKQKVMEPPVKGLTTRAQAKACQNRTSNRKK